eukprot:XP_014782588.1 PREDICTED: exocyst complex component 6B-like [Octopus bimaculoides]
MATADRGVPPPKTFQYKQWERMGETTVKDADLVREEAIKAHHDHLITEIESADGPLATTLRAVYDGDDLDKFMERLDSRIKNHDKEIERMCNHHYQGFIDSVRELLQVSNDAAKLKVRKRCSIGRLIVLPSLR